MNTTRMVNEEIKLIPYYPNYEIALEWYQDLDLCKQVDNRDSAYDLPLLMRMYILAAADSINGLPRKNLDYATPEELFEAFLDAVYAA